MLFPDEVRLMRLRYADYLLNIEHKPKWRRKLMDLHWRWRSKFYGLLEKPKTPISVCYHIVVFAYILIVHTSSALISHENNSSQENLKILANLEKALAFYFLIEFFLRIWSAGADGRFQGWSGRKKFLLQPMCIIDTLILALAIAVVLMAEYRYNGRFLEVLRFIQILRFLHIDRQMISWTLLKNFIERSKFELISIYYITSVVFALMAFLVFTLEAHESKGGFKSNSENATFDNYGQAFWFSAISIFTIGYGDIVPTDGLTRMVTCVFSYIGLCMFGAASTLAGVGLSLMLDHRNKEQKQTKVRNLAALTIQIWYRYHLVSNEKTFNSIPVYSIFCSILNRFEEKLKQQRLNTKRFNFSNTKQKIKGKRKFFINAIFVSSSELNEAEDESTHSLPRGKTQSELQILARKIASDTQKRRGSVTNSTLMSPVKQEKKQISFATRFLQSRKIGSSTSSTNHQLNDSFDYASDNMDGRDTDYYYSGDERSLGSCMTLSEDVSLSSSAVPLLTGKHKGILRLMYYLRFMVLRKRFKRARMPYELDDAEAELCELEHRRLHAFKQLEKQYSHLMGGKPKPEREDSDENASTKKANKTLISRVDECEGHLAQIETKARKLEETLIKLMNLIQQKTSDTQVPNIFSDSSPDQFVLEIPKLD